MTAKIIKIRINKLYHVYKPSLESCYKKFFGNNGHPLLWRNVPITVFACDYAIKGKNLLKCLDNHTFILYEYDRYDDSESVINDTHKLIAAKRVIKMVDSVKKHGYAEGKYNDKRHLIRVRKGFESPFGNDRDGFTLLARKHRAAACFALGMDEIKVKVTR